MRILFLCHRVPFPPDKGDKIRAFHELRALAAVHEVDLFTLADDPQDLAHRSALEKHCRRLAIGRVFPKLARLRSLPHLLGSTPLTIPYFYSPWLQAEVRTALSQRSYDRVFVYCSAMAQYVPWSKPDFRVPVVTDLVDVDSDKWTQYAAATRFPFSAVFKKEGRDLRSYERQICEDSACVVVATDREAHLARQIAPAARVHTISNGVNTAYFAPVGDVPPDRPRSVIFTGDMGYFPNQNAAIFLAREVLPLIRREMPHVRLLIVGRNPDRRVEALRAIEHVEVSGFVPDVRPWFARASAAVAPLRIAAGVQNKILEAMASALPVVATPRAVQGLKESVAEVVDTGETPQELADKLVRLLRDPLRAGAQGMEGRRRVAAAYSWERSMARLLHLMEDPGAARVDGDVGPVATSRERMTSAC